MESTHFPLNQYDLSCFERRYALARLGASLAHALGTPLQVISGRANLADRAAELEEAKQHIAIIVRKCREMSILLQTAVNQLRGPHALLEATDLTSLTRATLTSVFRSASGPPPEVHWDAEFPDCWQGCLASQPFVETLTTLLGSILRRAGKSPISVMVTRTAGLNSNILLEIACEWQGRALSDTLQRLINDPWQTSEEEHTGTDALEFLAPYEAARQNGATLSFQAPNRFLLQWPVETCQADSAGAS